VERHDNTNIERCEIEIISKRHIPRQPQSHAAELTCLTLATQTPIGSIVRLVADYETQIQIYSDSRCLDSCVLSHLASHARRHNLRKVTACLALPSPEATGG